MRNACKNLSTAHALALITQPLELISQMKGTVTIVPMNNTSYSALRNEMINVL